MFLLLPVSFSFAQKADNSTYKITGQILDLQDYSPLQSVTVRLLNQDSTLVANTLTNDNGQYSFNVPKKKNTYIIKASMVGFLTKCKSVRVIGKTTKVESIRLSEDAKMLANVEVTGNLPKVQAVEDTLVYNSDAFRLPDGSVLEELIERIPGAEVEDGKVTINGREVKKILLDGKEFFVGDMETALKNIPTTIIDKIKHYDEKSDMAKVTGIDDGQEQAVIDVKIKKGMNIGYNVNADLSYGTEHRYAERLNANFFRDNMKLSVFGNANNANGRSTPGRGGRGGGGGGGERIRKNFGANLNFDDKKKLKIDGNLRWNHNDNESHSRSSSESFVRKNGAFSNRESLNNGRSNGWNTEWRIEWKPTEDWNIQFRPTASISTSDNLQRSWNGSFNADPYKYMSDPLNRHLTLLCTEYFTLYADNIADIHLFKISIRIFTDTVTCNVYLNVSVTILYITERSLAHDTLKHHTSGYGNRFAFKFIEIILDLLRMMRLIILGDHKRILTRCLQIGKLFSLILANLVDILRLYITLIVLLIVISHDFTLPVKHLRLTKLLPVKPLFGHFPKNFYYC